MKQSTSRKFHAVVVGAALLLSSPFALGASDRDAQAEKRINNLYYGEILFHLYQKKYFATLTDLLIAQKQHPIAYQGDDPAWLLSGLAVTYGLYGLADETLERLFEPDKPQATRDIAWFYNAKLKFLQGDLAGAERSLTRIKTPYRRTARVSDSICSSMFIAHKVVWIRRKTCWEISAARARGVITPYTTPASHWFV